MEQGYAHGADNPCIITYGVMGNRPERQAFTQVADGGAHFEALGGLTITGTTECVVSGESRKAPGATAVPGCGGLTEGGVRSSSPRR
jgi:hypothetical protein